MTTFKWHATRPLTANAAAEFWQVRYQHSVTPWDRGETSPALTSWLENTDIEPSRILVPGCGRGYEVIELARRGFDVVGLDISPLALERLELELQSAGFSADLVPANVLNWTPRAPFDVIYEQTCLCALLPEQWPAYVTRLGQWLRPGGKLHILFMQTGKTGGPPFHCDMAAMHKLFCRDQWQWPDEMPLKVPHTSGLHELGYILVRRNTT